jgi:hypothetical protein
MWEGILTIRNALQRVDGELKLVDPSRTAVIGRSRYPTLRWAHCGLTGCAKLRSGC